MDELTGQQIAVAGVSLRRELFGQPLTFIRHLYALGVYNVAGISQEQVSPYRWKYHNGAGIGLGLDTLLGPVRIMAGLGDSGRFNLYLTLGPGF
jgi:hypothetical protein